MTRDLFIIFFFVAIIMAIIVIRIYANYQMEKLYDEILILAATSLTTAYVDKFIKLLQFRKRFYIFLNYYTRVERFKVRYTKFKCDFPQICEQLENQYL